MPLDLSRKTSFNIFKRKKKLDGSIDVIQRMTEKFRKSWPMKFFKDKNMHSSSNKTGDNLELKSKLGTVLKSNRKEKRRKGSVKRISVDEDWITKDFVERLRDSTLYNTHSHYRGEIEEDQKHNLRKKISDKNGNEKGEDRRHSFRLGGHDQRNKKKSKEVNEKESRSKSLRRSQSSCISRLSTRVSSRDSSQNSSAEKVALVCQLMLLQSISPNNNRSMNNSETLDLALDARYFQYYPQIFSYLRDRELIYKSNSKFLENSGLSEGFRALLVDWLIKVQLYTKCWTESLQTAVALSDSFLAVSAVKRSVYQLVGVSSLFLGCKVVQRMHPRPAQLCFLTEDCYTPHQVVTMEKMILDRLEWTVIPVLPHHFLHRTLLACIEITNTTLIESLVKMLLDAILLDPLCHTIRPSCRCAAAVCLARFILYENTLLPWTRVLQFYTKYSSCQLKPTIRIFVKVLSRIYDQDYPYQAVIEKYSRSSWSAIAKCDKLISFVKFPPKHQDLLKQMD